MLGDIGREWDRIRGSIAEILAHDDDRPEDVYAAVVNRQASLFVCDEGFVVLRIIHVPQRGLCECLVWLACGIGAPGHIERYIDQLKELARAGGASRLKFRSNRYGFDRLVESGWRRSAVEYVMEVG